LVHLLGLTPLQHSDFEFFLQASTALNVLSLLRGILHRVNHCIFSVALALVGSLVSKCDTLPSSTNLPRLSVFVIFVIIITPF
jgi:hypothetical protein